MSKAPKHSIYCLNCDWELKDTHKHTDGWKCPKCDGPAMHGKRRKQLMKNTITEEHIDDLFNQLEFETFHRVFGKQCIIVALLPNGFTVVGESACVNPDNYVEHIGLQIAIGRIKEKLWELEGYKLQSSLYERK